MKRPISFYDRETGEFLRGRTIDFGRQPIVTRANEDWKAGRHDRTCCRVDVATGEIVPLHDFAPVVSGNRISGLPEGTKAVFDLEWKIVGADGVLHVNVAWPQTVTVHLTRALYNYAQVTLDCTPEGSAPAGHELPQQYDRLRMAAYPDVRDGLDAMVKGGADWEAYRQKCLQVKEKFPKPEPKQ